MKQSYHFYNHNNMSSWFGRTYKKLDNPKRSKVYESKPETYYRSLDFILNKKYNKQTKIFSSFIKLITQFFSLKKELYTNGTKVCTEEFIFDNKF